jgi:hypothetical protein
MDAAQRAFLAVNEAVLLLAAERAGADGHLGGEVAFELPLVVRTDTATAEIVVSRSDTGRELYRLSHPQ